MNSGTGMDTHTKALLKAMSPETVKDLVRTELQTYDADKTGRTDYALESSGSWIENRPLRYVTWDHGVTESLKFEDVSLPPFSVRRCLSFAN